MGRKIIAGNWKMNLDYMEGLKLFSEIIERVKKEVTSRQKIVICSPFIHLQELVRISEVCDHISIGAQNVHQCEAGAYTGEISAKMIQSVGAGYVIVGHSERRMYYGETNQLLAKKVDILLMNGLKSIFCVGEKLDDRLKGLHFEVIHNQLTEGLFHLDSAQFSQIIIAYEPIWAIGTGTTASSKQVQEMHEFIRGQIALKYCHIVAENTTILYGGSLNSIEALNLFTQPDIDGGLVGGASLKLNEFMGIIKALNLQ